MISTYEIIRALPAKGFDWAGFNANLRAQYVTLLGRNVECWNAKHSLAGWDAAKGMREVRVAAMEMACFIVAEKSRRSFRSAPTQESAMWDSFEGGMHEVWTDAQAEETATQEIAELAKCYRK